MSLLGILIFIRVHGVAMGLTGIVLGWLFRRTGNPALALLAATVFTVSSLLLPTAVVLNLVTFATPPKKTPPAEVRRAQ
ncbi:hypothetical protein [Prosthecobacter sp.]|uniref:hypothetical protein n=1 Tax=Prosthecobacter sp. TaxID=1965333 RepID=UPI003784B0B4